jgi:hypothetical protein
MPTLYRNISGNRGSQKIGFRQYIILQQQLIGGGSASESKGSAGQVNHPLAQAWNTFQKQGRSEAYYTSYYDAPLDRLQLAQSVFQIVFRKKRTTEGNVQNEKTEQQTKPGAGYFFKELFHVSSVIKTTLPAKIRQLR